MATIRAYTTIEQSRKLAEFLPFESADMYWKNGVSDKYIQCFTPFVSDDYRTDVDYDYDVPCWSIGALIILLRDYDCVWLGANDIKCWLCEFNLGQGKHHVEKADTPIEACYNMVVWLLENNYIKKGE